MFLSLLKFHTFIMPSEMKPTKNLSATFGLKTSIGTLKQ